MTASESKTNVVNFEEDDIETIDIEVNVRGKKISLTDIPKNIEDCSFEVAENFQDNKPLVAFMSIIGERNRAKLNAAGLRVKELDSVMEAWSKAAGLGED